jgi:hypothetical protein
LIGYENVASSGAFISIDNEEVVEQIPSDVNSIVYVPTVEMEGEIAPVVAFIVRPSGLEVKIPLETAEVGVTELELV